MNLDWPGLLVGAGLGIPVGVVANMLYARYHANRLRAELRLKFGRIAGEYTAYQFPKNSEVIDLDQPIGECQLTYERENVLRLHYQELCADNVWEAEVWMETPYSGSMAWRYVRLGGQEPPREHRFGFKRCMVVEKPGRDGSCRMYLYLVGEGSFGNEALEKKLQAFDDN